MSKRTLKEQEYQLMALKYRTEKWFFGIFIELFANGLITYLLFHWNTYVAGCFGAWGIMSVWTVVKKYLRYAREHAEFKAKFEAMVLCDPNSFLSKLNKAVEDGEKELARMEQEMKDNDS